MGSRVSCSRESHPYFEILGCYETEWQGLTGFRAPQQNPSELSYLQIFATKTSFEGKQAICGCQRT